MASEPFRLTPEPGRTLYGLLDPPAGEPPWPVAVICHGFKGFMEWGFFPHLAELLAQRGFAAVRFNFSGAGMKPGDELVTDLAAFRANTFSRERDELLAVLAALGGAIGGQRLDLGRLGLFGHSRGGAAALLAAAGEPWRGKIGALVTWNAVGRIDRFPPEQLELWRRQGELTVLNARTGQELPLGPELLAEVESPPPGLDLPAAAGRRTAPWLILHGDEDESVPVAEGRELAAAAAEPRTLQLVRRGSHTFGARHPFAGPTPELIEALNATQGWYRRHLKLEA